MFDVSLYYEIRKAGLYFATLLFVLSLASSRNRFVAETRLDANEAHEVQLSMQEKKKKGKQQQQHNTGKGVQIATVKLGCRSAVFRYSWGFPTEYKKKNENNNQHRHNSGKTYRRFGDGRLRLRRRGGD
jgi:hypothetical protein